jgi:exosortase C (VPDSG-CTERM-specific)
MTPTEDTSVIPASSGAEPVERPLASGDRRQLRRLAIYSAVVLAAFGWHFFNLFRYTLDTELHSHVVLIPFISAWLLRLKAEELPRGYHGAFGWAAAFLLAGIGVLVAAWRTPGAESLSRNDQLGIVTLSALCFLTAGGFAFLGSSWMKAALFPVCFLLFLIPLPDAATEFMEYWSQVGSTMTGEWLLWLAGIPHMRDGFVFSFPGITSLELARECSGIRSSWVLFITCLLAAHLFLRSPWRRFFLVAFVIPLGLLRNGFRFATLAWLCLNVSEDMIDSAIHHRGGPIFFALSLIPLGLLVWWLRRGDGGPSSEPPPEAPAANAPAPQTP